MRNQDNGTIPHLAFTFKFPGKVRQLITPVGIESGDMQYTASRSLWDTGATTTCISDMVADTLNLIPTGKGEIHTPSGSKIINTYLVNIYLPNQVRIEDVVVYGSDIGNQNLDLLIGMDIISLGDFAITQSGGSTTFSFCYPSIKPIDFVAQVNAMRTVGPKHGQGKKKRK